MNPPTDAHAWRFYLSPAETWDAMYEDCAKATHSIDMEQYIFENDETGQKFMHLFIRKAKEGIQVRLLCDEVGSRTFFNSPLIPEFRQSGGVFNFYNSIKLIDIFKPKRLFPRTHIKALVVDATITYIGGVCLARRMTNWRDTQIRVAGPVAQHVMEALNRNSRNRAPAVVPQKFPFADFFYVQSDPGFFRHPIYRAMLEAIGHAKEFVYISEAFFVPTRRLRRLLKQAVGRGVSVIVLVPEQSDFWIADWAFLAYAARMLKAGIRIFRYQPTVLHTKTIVIDGNWGTVGSCNMDALSFFHNREANLIVKNGEALAEMKKDFLNDLERSNELTLELFKQIPLWKRALAHLARLGRSFL